MHVFASCNLPVVAMQLSPHDFSLGEGLNLYLGYNFQVSLAIDHHDTVLSYFVAISTVDTLLGVWVSCGNSSFIVLQYSLWSKFNAHSNEPTLLKWEMRPISCIK